MTEYLVSLQAIAGLVSNLGASTSGVSAQSTDAQNSTGRRVSSERMTVNYNGEPIHVALTDLFQVVSQRYKTSVDSFIPAEK